MSLFVVRKEMSCIAPHACSFPSPSPGLRLHLAYLSSKNTFPLHLWHLLRLCAQQQKHQEKVPCRLPPKHCSYFKNYPHTYLCCSPAPIPETLLRRRCVQKPIFSRHQTFHSISTSSHPGTKNAAPNWTCVCFLPKRHSFKHMVFAATHSSHPPFLEPKITSTRTCVCFLPKDATSKRHVALFHHSPTQNQPQRSTQERDDSPLPS